MLNEGEEKAGRAPNTVEMWPVLATAVNPSREDYLRKMVGRMATYMQAPGYAEMLIALNEWDTEPLEAFRANKTVGALAGGIDSVATLEQLDEISTLIPDEWLPSASGSTEECALAWKNQFDNGADGLVIHGSTPEEFAPVVKAYEALKA